MEEMLKYAYLLDDNDKQLIKTSGVKAYDKIFNVKYTNIFAPQDDYEKENLMAPLVRVFRDPQYIALCAKHIFNLDIPPFQAAILQELERRKYPMLIGSRGMSKSFLMALYALWLMLFKQGSKVVITGSGFRQAKVVFNYMHMIWKGAPIFRDIIGGGKNAGPKFNVDECRFHVGDSFTVAIPVGDGSRIRGLRGSCLISDEFSSLSEQIYEQVISGFASVQSSPMEAIKNKARVEVLKYLGIEEKTDKDTTPREFGNQSIISGTTDYAFKHFCKYWKHYKAIVNSKGQKDKLEELFPEGIPQEFNWRNYSVIRIPFELIPDGFMDKEHVARSRATSHEAMYMMEYGAVFPQDSDGFFKRTLIESCVCNDASYICHPSCGRVIFDAVLGGNPSRWYVIAVDPASEQDNFAITVIECWPEHRRIVYCWTINKRKHRMLLAKGLTTEKDFYSYCARKIRNLMKSFPCTHLTMDSQGGGYAIAEALHDEKELVPGESLIWPVIDPEDKKDSDGFEGLHILELVSFSDAEWRYHANHSLKKDMEDKSLLFPRFNEVELAMALEKDKAAGRLDEQGESVVAETLEDVMFEIEELKNELTTIEHTQTPTGLDKWDTPEIKHANSRKGRLRKDRYTALLMANMAARTIQRAPVVEQPEQLGFAAKELTRGLQPANNGDFGGLYIAPAWYKDHLGGALVNKGGVEYYN